MKPSEWVAIVTGILGAITGMSSLAWNIYIKLTSGPKLRIQAWANMVLYPTQPRNPRFLSIKVQNVGTTPTTLTNLEVSSYKVSVKAVKKLKGSGFNAVAETFLNQKYPFPKKLDVGEEWSGQIGQSGVVDELVVKNSLWVSVHHSFSKTPVQVKVLRGPRNAK